MTRTNHGELVSYRPSARRRCHRVWAIQIFRGTQVRGEGLSVIPGRGEVSQKVSLEVDVLGGTEEDESGQKS